MNNEENPNEEANDIRVVEGVPISIVISIGPGVLVDGGPKGTAADVFLHDGCIHSLVIALIARCGQLGRYAYAAALDEYRASGLEKQEGGDDQPTNPNLVA